MTTEDYILAHIDPEPEYLRRLYRATQVHLLRGRMASGHLQGRLLKMLVQMSGARRVLEIGTFSGYATICLSEGLPDGGVVHTFEVNDEQEDFTRPWLEGRYDRCGMPDEVFSRIHFHIGDARDWLASDEGLDSDLGSDSELDLPSNSKTQKLKNSKTQGLPTPFDLAFIDGDKRQYIECYELVMQHIRPGGLILADNTLWDGHVLEVNPHERMTQGIQQFNDHVLHDPRVTRIMLPLRDGLTIIRKL